MLISSEKKDILISDLQKPPFVNIYDQTENYGENPDTGQMDVIPYKKMELVYFNERNYKNKLLQKLKQFRSEVNSVRLLSGINLELYISETINDFIPLHSLFATITMDHKQLIWREDCKVYFDARYMEDETINNLGIIPLSTLQKISSNFILQKTTIENVLHFLESLLPEKQKGNYRTKYPYKYFQFNQPEKLNNEEWQESKIEFCKDLVTQGLINSNDQKAILDFFSDSPHQSKIKWNGTREELNYLINEMVKLKIIKNPLRERSRLIAKVFCDSYGNEFPPTNFHSLHKPTNTRNIDNILSILK